MVEETVLDRVKRFSRDGFSVVIGTDAVIECRYKIGEEQEPNVIVLPRERRVDYYGVETRDIALALAHHLRDDAWVYAARQRFRRQYF